MDVKVCNLRDSDFDEQFRKSVMDTGFAVITHHGIDPSLIKETQQAWRMFFLNDLEYKKQFVNQIDRNLGYNGFKSEKAVGASKADLKEFFHYRPGATLPHEVAAISQFMFAQLEDIGIRILHGLDVQYEKCCDQSDKTLLRTLYYPALDFNAEPGAVRAAAHEDINFITLLVAASAPGLQVMDNNGRWFDVPHEENSIVVNIGDMLQMMSKGLYKSTTHRVINPDNSRSDRVSMPLFMHPHSETLLADGFTAKQYLDQRIAEIIQKG